MRFVMICCLYKTVLLAFGIIPILAFEEQGKAEGRLLFAKQVLNKRIVQEKELILKYTLYNVGSGAAFNVCLSDETFDENSFEIAVGYLNVKIFSIAAGKNASHTVVLRPKIAGPVNISSATVTYQRSTDVDDIQVGESNDLGTFVVESYEAHLRRNCCHLTEWCYFALATLVFMMISKRNGFHL